MFGRKKTEKEELAEKMEAGALRVLVTFEVVGKPKSHVEKSLEEYLENIKKDERITIVTEERGEAEEQEGFWSTFAESEMIINDLGTVIWLCINFSPASIEILEPENKTMTAPALTAWINDFLSKLHEVASVIRDTQQKNVKLNESLNALIKNAIVTALETGNLDAKGIQQKIGIHKDQLKPFLEHLVKTKRIKQAGETYSL